MIIVLPPLSICVEKYLTNHIIHSVLQFNTFFYSQGFFSLDPYIELQILFFLNNLSPKFKI